jgi:hypothetical protein
LLEPPKEPPKELSQSEYLAKLETRLRRLTGGGAAAPEGMPFKRGVASALQRIGQDVVESDHLARREKILESPLVSSLADPAAQYASPSETDDDDTGALLGEARSRHEGRLEQRIRKSYVYVGDSSSSDDGAHEDDPTSDADRGETEEVICGCSVQ